LSLSWARRIQSTHFQLPLISIRILSSHPSESSLNKLRFPTDILYAFFVFLIRATCPAHIILDGPSYIWWGVKIIDLSIAQYSVSLSRSEREPVTKWPPLFLSSEHRITNTNHAISTTYYTN
jgi:hypothetical protein